jgi:hypothetical protein
VIASAVFAVSSADLSVRISERTEASAVCRAVRPLGDGLDFMRTEFGNRARVRETGIAGFEIPRGIDLYSGQMLEPLYNQSRQALTEDLRFN